MKQFKGSGGHNFFEVINHGICHIFLKPKGCEVSWCLHITCRTQHIILDDDDDDDNDDDDDDIYSKSCCCQYLLPLST